tara:strand:+ start:420 stop:857 length:438 start_codon:yes stop_codon:yes gene_type:complete
MPTTSLENAVKAGMNAVRRIHGAPITYSRDSTTLTVSRAIQGRTFKTTIDVGEKEQVVEAADFIIKVIDLGNLAPPQKGDIIVRTVEGQTYTWTVETLSIGESPWDWSDTARTFYRIRTRKDGADAYEVSEPSGFDLAGDELKHA